MQETPIGWTDLDPVNQLFNQLGVKIVMQRVKEFLYSAIVLTAVTWPTGGNQIQRLRRSSFGYWNNVINRGRNPHAVGAHIVPQFKDGRSYVGVDDSHPPGAGVHYAFNLCSIFRVARVSFALYGRVAWAASAEPPVDCRNPIPTLIAPFFAVGHAFATLNQGGPIRSMLGKPAVPTNSLESIPTGPISSERLNRKPTNTFTTPLQALMSKAQIFIGRKAHRSGRVLDCSEV